MIMTLANAKIYVAQIIGGQGDTNLIAAAGDAIVSAIGKWNRQDQGWTFCLKDTSSGFVIPTCSIALDGVTVTSTSTALLGVNQGVTVYNPTFTSTYNTVAHTTVVDSIVRNAVTGAVTSFTLKDAQTPTVVVAPPSDTPITLTIGPDIPLLTGVNRYSLPADLDKPYSARLLSNKRVLTYIKYREVGRKVADLDSPGTPTHYTTYNQNGFDATTEHKNMLVFRTPSAADTLRLYYYRDINAAADPLDVPADFIYPLLHYAQYELVRSKNGDDSRLAALAAIANAELKESMDNDSFESEDEDLRMLSQMEMGLRTNVNLDIWDEIM